MEIHKKVNKKSHRVDVNKFSTRTQHQHNKIVKFRTKRQQNKIHQNIFFVIFDKKKVHNCVNISQAEAAAVGFWLKSVCLCMCVEWQNQPEDCWKYDKFTQLPQIFWRFFDDDFFEDFFPTWDVKWRVKLQSFPFYSSFFPTQQLARRIFLLKKAKTLTRPTIISALNTSLISFSLPILWKFTELFNLKTSESENCGVTLRLWDSLSWPWTLKLRQRRLFLPTRQIMLIFLTHCSLNEIYLLFLSSEMLFHFSFDDFFWAILSGKENCWVRVT